MILVCPFLIILIFFIIFIFIDTNYFFGIQKILANILNDTFSTRVLILLKFGMQVLRMLHRQVHPENSLAEEEFIEFHKENIKALGHNADLASENEDNRKFLTESKSMERIQRYKNDFQYGLSGSNINGNGEYWIKTDADCKY